MKLTQVVDVFESNFGSGPEPEQRPHEPGWVYCEDWDCDICYDQSSNHRAEWKAFEGDIHG